VPGRSKISLTSWRPPKAAITPTAAKTYGDSMIVDAWGNILDRRARGSGMALAEVDLDQVRHLRSTFPVLEHRRL